MQIRVDGVYHILANLIVLALLSMNVLRAKSFRAAPFSRASHGRLVAAAFRKPSDNLGEPTKLCSSSGRCMERNGMIRSMTTDVETGLTGQRLVFEGASYMIPHPAKAQTGGEDACFVSSHSVGVFDGVGGWATLGVDTGLYSRELARLTALNIEEQRNTTGSDAVDLVSALEYALKNNPNTGSTTAVVAAWDPRGGLLRGANLGDSGALCLRRDAAGEYFVLLRTAAQEHGFNFPYQLGTNCTDMPSDAELFEFAPRAGDVLVLASDGVLDNLFEQDIIDCVVETLASNNPEAVQGVQKMRRETAFNFSIDAERKGPWEEGARKAGKLERPWSPGQQRVEGSGVPGDREGAHGGQDGRHH
ncbi:unnamed protein product, partial [Heterosigma akashiwo]